MNTTCPAPDAIKALFDGHRPPHDARAVLTHVEGCLACRGRLVALAPGAELPTSYLPEVGDSVVFEETPVAAKGGTVSETLGTDFAVFASLKAEPKSEVPRRVGGYDVIRVLGRGGMGIVLKALDPVLNRFVAVKLMFPKVAADASCRFRFGREARSAARIGSDHATAVYSVGEDGAVPYIVMEYVAGENLETRLAREGRLPLSVVVAISRQIVAGLAAAHAQGVVHRDIKPGNILLERPAEGDGGGGGPPVRVKITDFGIARSIGLPGITNAEHAVGTPEYMAPEQINGDELDARSDLYSFGMLLYRMVAGRLPFTAKTAMACFANHLNTQFVTPKKYAADLPDWLEALVMKLLRKDPADRPQTAAEVGRLLDEGSARLLGPPLDPEAKRVAALKTYGVLDTDPEQAFDDLTHLASYICGTPIAIVSLLDEDRQWFKSKVGLSVNQTAKNVSFCQYTIKGTAPMIVGNAEADARFADNPLVKLDPHIRFYAGVPLIDGDGAALGSLCVIDRVQRELSSEQIAALAALGRSVMSQLALRRELLRLNLAAKLPAVYEAPPTAKQPV
ncbi:GAF domain-containing serine/threonine-protein kinase [Gemmata sp.]|uniref:GAF domain-containing serine/threonine-protein kinase n=1 Tax=Gemmata sp. TaxID=1914242 RepID=UPI003F7149EB